MRKIILTLLCISVIEFSDAQELLSKKGLPILPEAKDWSLGFDAVFLLNYLGNMFNNNTNNTALAKYQVNQAIVGKIMKDASTAYVMAVRIGNVSVKTTAPIKDETSNPAAPAQPNYMNDTKTNTRTNINLAAGMQKYRGKGRLKGVYGAGLGLMLGNDNFLGTGGKDTYTYSNEISTTYATAATSASTDFGNGVDGISNISQANSSRAIEVKTGSVFGIGMRGWLGIEYFFAPKISLGAQYGWAIYSLWTGEGSRTEEKYDGTSGPISNTRNTNKSSTFYIDNDNLSGQIILSAYF
jgi:hypothetical protein